MRVIAVDFGTRRIGLAVSDSTGTLARPLAVIAGSTDPVRASLAVLAAIESFERTDERIDTIVVGRPLRLDGRPTDTTAQADALAADLGRRAGRQVVLQDERLTSHEADALLAEHETDWRARKRKLDAAAAAVMLQEYLDRQGARE